MRKKGFTLIELLAVIVVLAIIALITTPTILGVIETAKKGVFRDSIYGLMDATNIYMAKNLETGTMEFICDGTDCELENGDKLSFKGETPKSGMIKVDKDHKISVEYISNGTYCAYGTLENLVIDKDCEQLDTTKPVLDDSKLNVTTTTSSLTVNILKGFAKDPESGIKEYKVTVNGETKTLKEIGTLTFDGLDKNKTYEIKIEVENGKGLKSELIKEYTTLQFLSPSIALTNTPTTAVNGYLKSQVAKITYNGTNITSPKYFVKTTREGTSSLAVTATCGTGTTPSACTNVTSTKTLTANTWYQVSGNVNVTYNKAASATGTVYAITYDGTNYSGASTATISKIDTTSPTFTVNSSTGGVGFSGTISIENVNEQESGIEGYYIGQVKPNSIGDNVTFGKSTSFTINAFGTWYVAIKDNAGNMSKVQSVVYYSLTLNSDGATNYSTNSAFIKVGTSVNLPAGLVKSGYKADTWTGGISSIKIDKNISLTPNWYKLTTSLMDNNWSCNNNCKTGQSTYSISSSALTAQTWGNYNASWYINFSKTVNMTDFNYLQMNISATLYNRGTVRVYIDSTVIYIAQFNNISGVFINQNISSYTGNHTIKINFEQSNSGNSAGSTANSMTVTDVKLTN